jgi:tetratricopeptide (TPR) repeat protein
MESGIRKVTAGAGNRVRHGLPVRYPFRLPLPLLLLLLFPLPIRLNAQAGQPPVEAISLLGDSLRRPTLAPEVEARMATQLQDAETELRRRPGVEALIWVGRRTAYLGRYNEAIAVFSTGLARYPNDARLYRHRAHRYLTTRHFDRAIADLLYAARLVQGQPDQVEPDGQPNARNIPTSTLQSNIWYHLGLAYYLKGDFRRALAAYRECLKVSANPDMQVATRYWLYLTLRRMGSAEQAKDVLHPVNRSMDVIENGSYHRLLLMFKGELPPDSLVSGSADRALEDATAGYGLGAWHFVNGRRDQAIQIWRQILQTGPWNSFGYLAAESEVARLTGNK